MKKSNRVKLSKKQQEMLTIINGFVDNRKQVICGYNNRILHTIDLSSYPAHAVFKKCFVCEADGTYPGGWRNNRVAHIKFDN